ncbi:uncharacterized protein LOC18432382 isoform X2 [Amborella trichopoda]|uniref:uncharacterized protein LOC18432382 isoform X2 n=1 Tax=Amborella trichopoda TaxID=13333 RepID=UPI0009BF21B6|nr:uncharacterized protein LOC18432382 isoform X2 [Amborella trichopoda]|eukprot:XP_020521819.1 uncharacterized protein LOC18432382 isoform X2 [Amborella trichopoda]
MATHCIPNTHATKFPLLLLFSSTKSPMLCSKSAQLRCLRIYSSINKRSLRGSLASHESNFSLQRQIFGGRHIFGGKRKPPYLFPKINDDLIWGLPLDSDLKNLNISYPSICALSSGITAWLCGVQVAHAAEGESMNMVYEIGELFELGIQLSYLLFLLGFLGLGSFFVVRQILVRRELDLSAKELQEQVRSGDASATEYFELGAVMLRRKFYPAATKYLQLAIGKWDGDQQDLAQVHNALGVSYVRDGKLDKGIVEFEKAVKLQPGYVTAWNNLGDAYEKRKDLRAALKSYEEALLFDPNNKVARPRRDALRDRVKLYKGVPLKSEER